MPNATRSPRAKSAPDKTFTVGSRKKDPAKVRKAEQLKPHVLGDRISWVEAQLAALSTTVRTRHLEVVDSEGRVRVNIEGDHIKILDSHGDTRAILGFSDGTYPGFHLTADDNVVATLAVVDRDEERGVEGKTFLALMDFDGGRALDLCVSEDGTVTRPGLGT